MLAPQSAMNQREHMPQTFDTPSDWADRAPIPRNQDRFDVRWFAAFGTAVLVALCTDAALYILFGQPQTLLYKVASVSFSRPVIGIMFAAAMLCMLPHLLHLIFKPVSLSVCWPRVGAVAGAFLAAVAWAQMANLAQPLDVGTAVRWLMSYCGGVRAPAAR
ncbi:MAG: hypothetical protein EOO54_17535 [Haliea sp.]|nr:MAG: hypothetical protein EOO54_17535 [Haliea sp.]